MVTATRGGQEEGHSLKENGPPATRRRRKVLNAAVFSQIGIRLFPRLAPAMYKLYNIILNNDLTPEINGERWLVSQLRDPRVLVDVGFHRGEWTREAVERFPQANIYAFDPWPPAQVFFQGGSFGGNVQFFDLALSKTEGRSRFYDYDSGCNSLTAWDFVASPLVDSYDVDVTTLDSWCAAHRVDHIDLLKIDVEGYDLAVLEGAHQLMQAQAIEVFTFEYGGYWIASRRFLGEADRYVRERGYSLFKLFPDFLAPFVYRPKYETFQGAMFVALSPSALTRRMFPIRRVAGL
jgi:FkbM family methyltransferase